MSRIFGEIRQVAYITDDIDRTLTFLQRNAGIGPWFVARGVTLKGVDYRGTTCDLTIDAALANSGSLQVEVIRQHGDTPSMYTEFTDRNGFGLLPQHYSVWPTACDATLAAAAEAGFEVIQSGQSAYGPLAYLQHPDQPDFYMEVTELSPERRSIFDQVRAAAVDWDGTDPVREGWPTPKV
ncbi:MAG: VOC family protein [Pseudomonadota bacterium]|nr:VOC family protein [Pseudomonadota bacterium]